MSLSTVLVGEFWADDGDCDEPDGDRPNERIAGSGCKQDQSKERYPDFGPTLAAEKLAELHDIHLARETIRQWIITAGLWKDRRARLKAVHQPRYRRDCLGELIQIDGSEHWWFEGRGPQCTLLSSTSDDTTTHGSA